MKKLLTLVALVATLVGCCCNHNESPAFDKFNSVVYEFNVRQATEEGTFAAAEQYLPELKAMGVDIRGIWMMWPGIRVSVYVRRRATKEVPDIIFLAG